MDALCAELKESQKLADSKDTNINIDHIKNVIAAYQTVCVVLSKAQLSLWKKETIEIKNFLQRIMNAVGNSELDGYKKADQETSNEEKKNEISAQESSIFGGRSRFYSRRYKNSDAFQEAMNMLIESEDAIAALNGVDTVDTHSDDDYTDELGYDRDYDDENVFAQESYSYGRRGRTRSNYGSYRNSIFD